MDIYTWLMQQKARPEFRRAYLAYQRFMNRLYMDLNPAYQVRVVEVQIEMYYAFRNEGIGL